MFKPVEPVNQLYNDGGNQTILAEGTAKLDAAESGRAGGGGSTSEQENALNSPTGLQNDTIIDENNPVNTKQTTDYTADPAESTES